MADAVTSLEAGGKTPPAALDEVMMAMDVVDTLRHNENVALQELGQEGRDDALKAQLRRIYESQGLAVSDRILDEGIRALKESRFVYSPTGSGRSRWLAGLWVRRGVVAKWLAVIVVVIGAWIGWEVWNQAQVERQAEAARIELAQTLPKQLRQSADAALAEARANTVKERIGELRSDGEAAIARADTGAVRAAIASLESLRQQLVQTYVLRIVSRPGEQSGIFRIPDANSGARNYYLIVEALTPDGKTLSMPVTSEEDGVVRTVSKWGIRVPQQTYDAVRRDKQDDGIVQNNVLGQKLRGTLNPAYTMPVMNGAITKW